MSANMHGIASLLQAPKLHVASIRRDLVAAFKSSPRITLLMSVGGTAGP